MGEEMMKTNEAREKLINLLREVEFDFHSPNPKIAWDVFKEFTNLHVQCDDDALLFQCGVYSFTGKELFHFEFVRQFIFNVDGVYDHTEQLMLTMYFEKNQELQELETNLWTYDCESVGEFFSKVENMKHFIVPIDKYKPLRCEIDLEVV